MGKVVKIIVALAVAAFVVLGIYGIAIWVFIPLLPAGIIFLIVVYSERQRRRPAADREADREKDRRKAA